MSAWVTREVASQGGLASGASGAAPWQSTADRFANGSVTLNDVIVTLPVFVTRKLKVTLSPTAVAAVALEFLVSVTRAVSVSGVDSTSSSETGPAVAVWPLTAAALR